MTLPTMPELDTGHLDRLAENERHFHTIQAGVRGLASTWMLSAFAAMALLLKQEPPVRWLLPPFRLLIVVAIMANIGLAVLWIIDQMVYQRLFNTNYFAGLRLEQQYPAIPPVRALQALTRRGRSIASWVQLFYVGPMLVFTLAALAAVMSIGSTIGAKLAIGAVVTALSLGPIAWVAVNVRKVSFEKVAISLPGDFASILADGNLRTIVERHVQGLNVFPVEGSEERIDAQRAT